MNRVTLKMTSFYSFGGTGDLYVSDIPTTVSGVEALALVVI